jgi:Na+-driven multidrug efflux pump
MNTTEKKMFKNELITIAFPLALQSLLNALVGASDALMLGRLTQDAVAAVSLANQISFIMSLFNGSVVGSVGVLVAQYWGKKDNDSARNFMSIGIRYSFAISVVFFFTAFLFPEKLMSIFTIEPELIRIGAGYLKIVSFSFLFSGISQVYLVMMKIGGRAKMSVWISAMTVLVDMSADFFLIYGFGAIPSLGANGSAYSTVIVEMAALIWCIVESYQKDHIHPDSGSIRFFSLSYEKDIWKIAKAMLASSMAWGLSISAHSFIMGHLGTDATAAASIIGVTQQLIQCLTQGLSSGARIMTGKLLGQDLFDKAKQYGRQFWNVAFFSGFANILLLGIVGPLVYIFYKLEPLA